MAKPNVEPMRLGDENANDDPGVLQPATGCYNSEGFSEEPDPPKRLKAWIDLHGDRVDGQAVAGTLTLLQRNAIDLLVLGRSDAIVATRVGVHRVTVTRWRLYHLAFQAELNQRRQEVWGAAGDRARSLLAEALNVFRRQIRSDDPAISFRASRALIHMAGSGRFAPPAPADAPPDPDGVLDGHARRTHIELQSALRDPPHQAINDTDRYCTLIKLSDRHARHAAACEQVPPREDRAQVPPRSR